MLDAKKKWFDATRSKSCKLGTIGAAGILLLASACATGPQRYVQPLPTAEQRSQFGPMGVTSAVSGHRSEPQRMLAGTGKAMGRGAARGALGGAALGAYAGLSTGPFAVIVSPALAVAGAIGGATIGTVAGAAQGRSKADVEAAAEAISTALREAKPGESIRAVVVRDGTGMRPHRLTVIERPVDDEARQALSQEGYRSVLWLNVTHFGLRNEGKPKRFGPVNPAARLVVHVAGAVRDVSDGRVIYQRHWAYRSEAHPFYSWGKNGGAQTRSEMETAYRQIGHQIAVDLFSGSATLPVRPDRGAARSHYVPPVVVPRKSRATGGEGEYRDDSCPYWYNERLDRMNAPPC